MTTTATNKPTINQLTLESAFAQTGSSLFEVQIKDKKTPSDINLSDYIYLDTFDEDQVRTDSYIYSFTFQSTTLF